MESVLGAGGRPKCLVIDEIDGAPTVGLLGRPAGGLVIPQGGCVSLPSPCPPRPPLTFS